MSVENSTPTQSGVIDPSLIAANPGIAQSYDVLKQEPLNREIDIESGETLDLAVQRVPMATQQTADRQLLSMTYSLQADGEEYQVWGHALSNGGIRSDIVTVTKQGFDAKAPKDDPSSWQITMDLKLPHKLHLPTGQPDKFVSFEIDKYGLQIGVQGSNGGVKLLSRGDAIAQETQSEAYSEVSTYLGSKALGDTLPPPRRGLVTAPAANEQTVAVDRPETLPNYEDRFKSVEDDPNFRALVQPHREELKKFWKTYDRLLSEMEAKKESLRKVDSNEAYAIDTEVASLKASYEKARDRVRSTMEANARPYLAERLKFFSQDHDAGYIKPGELALQARNLVTARGKSIGHIIPGIKGTATRDIFYGQIIGPARTSGWGGNSRTKTNPKTGEKNRPTREHILDLATAMLSGNFDGGDEIIIKRDQNAEYALPKELQGKVPLYRVIEGMHRTVAIRLLDGMDATVGYDTIKE